jgi:amino acid transporter
MARDRLAPAGLARLNRSDTPITAIWVLAVFAAGMVLAFAAMIQAEFNPFGSGQLKDPFDVLTDFAVFGAAGLETLMIAGIFVLRRRYPQSTHPLPYRCPGYPVVPAVYVLVMLAVLANMFWSPDQRTVALIGVGFIVVGAAVYAVLFAGRK